MKGKQSITILRNFQLSALWKMDHANVMPGQHMGARGASSSRVGGPLLAPKSKIIYKASTTKANSNVSSFVGTHYPSAKSFPARLLLPGQHMRAQIFTVKMHRAESPVKKTVFCITNVIDLAVASRSIKRVRNIKKE